MTSRAAVVVLLVLTAAAPARAELTPVGPELQVNTYTTGFQTTPDVAMDPSGRFVVTWQSGFFFGPSPDGSGSGVFAQGFDADGTPLGTEFRANTFTLGPQFDPSVAADGAGRFVITWTSGSYNSYPSQDGSVFGAFVQRYDANGTPLGPEFQANTYTTARQHEAAVVADAAGNFVVVWTSAASYYANGQDGSRSGVFAQRYDASGAAVGPEFQVNSYTTGPQEQPSVAIDATTGAFVVAWQSGGYGFEPDGDGAGVFARRFDAAGVPAGPDFQVNTYTTGSQRDPHVAAASGGGFVVVWQSGGYYGGAQDGSDAGIFGQRFDASGAPVGPEFQANTYTTGTQGYPDVAVDAAGNFVVVWAGAYNNQDGDADGVFGQEFTGAGVPDGPEFQVNTYTTGYQNGPVVAAGPGGTFVVAWQSGQDGSFQGIVAQRFRAVGPLRVLLGSKLRLEDDTDTTRRRLLVRSVDPSITLGGGNGSSDDPTVSGGRLRVQSATFKQTYDLPAANWKTIGPPGANRGYVYQDPFLFAGPVAAVKVRAGQRLRVWAKGSQLGQTLASNPYPVRVILQTGDLGHRYCMTFGGVASFKPGRLFLAHGAPAACP
jgi:hypothetical protein